MFKFVLIRANGGFTVNIDSSVPDGAIVITDAEYNGLLAETHTFNGVAVVAA